MTGAITCSDWTREQLVDPIGTAGNSSGFLLLEHPLPWPREAGELDGLSDIASVAKALNVRLQAVVPEQPGAGRVTMYRWDEALSRYTGRERVVSPADVLSLAGDLMAGDGAGAELVQNVDVLICTHGARDRCCGASGTKLHMEALAKGLGPTVRIRRTSHLGGHRFAPTALLLPEGTSWAFLDYEALAQIVHRRGPVSEQLGRYRGCTGLGSPAAQALERALLAEVGWTLFGCRRTITEAGAGLFEITTASPEGYERSWRGRITAGRRVGVPTCPAIGEPERFDTELLAELLDEIGILSEIRIDNIGSDS